MTTRTPGQRREFVRFILICTGFLASIAVVWANLDLSSSGGSPIPTLLQFFLFLLSIVLIIMGVGGVSFPVINNARWREISILAALTLLALMIRLWQIEDAVHVFVLDEYWFIVGVNGFDGSTPLIQRFSLATPYSGIYPFLQRSAVDLLGATITAVRLSSVILGTLTIPALYLLGKWLFHQRIGIIAALLLAAFPPHIHFSRLGINNIADPLFGVLALAFLAHGLRKNTTQSYAIAGAMLGLTHYFYDAGRFLFIPLIVLWLGIEWLLDRRSFDRQRWNSLATFALVAAAVSLPYYMVTLSGGFSLTSRLDDMSWGRDYISESIALLPRGGIPQVITTYFNVHLLPVIQHYSYSLDAAPYFYGGDQSMILPFAVPFFIAGWIFGWRRTYRRGIILPVLALALATFGISLILPLNWTVRFPVTFPVIALLTAIGIDSLSAFLPRYHTILIAIIVGALMVAQSIYYFNAHLPLYNQQIRTQHDYMDAVMRARDFPDGTQVHFITDDPVDIPYVQVLDDFWSLDLTFDHISVTTLTLAELVALPRDVDHVFFINSDDSRTPTIIQQVFVTDPPQFTPYSVPLNRQYVLYYARAE